LTIYRFRKGTFVFCFLSTLWLRFPIVAKKWKFAFSLTSVNRSKSEKLAEGKWGGGV
jgi:hypothetical protein